MEYLFYDLGVPADEVRVSSNKRAVSEGSRVRDELQGRDFWRVQDPLFVELSEVRFES